MNLAGRLAAAIEVLADIDARHRPVAEALKDWGVSHRFAGSKDRGAVGNLVYDALRRRRSLAWIMDADTPRALVLAAAAIGWGMGTEGLALQIAGSAYGPEPLSATEIDRLAVASLEAAPDSVRADVPEWLAPLLAAALGEGWIAEAAALAERPPLDLRVNRLKVDRARVAAAIPGLAETRFAPDGLRAPPIVADGRHPNLQVEPGFQKGWFEIQDEGSQLAALMVSAAPGMQVLDLCAGAGGKTLAMAAAMANRGQVHATDADKQRLAPIFERLKRAGTRNVQVHAARSDLSGLTGTMDRVLVDAPCTGSGTWRRRPDIKWRLADRALAGRLGEQATLLDEAAGFVKPGGVLAYVTCSVLGPENAEQVSAFLARRADFAALPADEVIAGAGLEAAAAAELGAAVGRPAVGLQLTPLRTATDGFYVAALRRAAT